MSGNRIVVIGASAGGVEALRQFVSLLPIDFPAPILIVVHTTASSKSMLPLILARAGLLHGKHAEDGDVLRPAHIYIAPPDMHLLAARGEARLSRGPRENGHRPAVDTLFRSAARYYGPRAIGVILSGVLDDGTAGLSAIKEQGGIAIVQDPEEALYPGMPQSAIDYVTVDHVLAIPELAETLVRLAATPVEDRRQNTDRELKYETDIVQLDLDAIENERDRPGRPSEFVCPDCGGTLWEVAEGDVLRYRCHVGHAFSAETFLSEQGEAVESALWIALRTLEDNAAIVRRMVERSRQRNRPHATARYEARIKHLDKQAATVRDLLASGLALPKVGGERPADEPAPDAGNAAVPRGTEV